MSKAIECRHCNVLFKPVRKGHIHCSDTCRKLRNKEKSKVIADQKRNRRLAEKLKKLSSSTFGRYLVREIKRAKTVQIFTGHSAESLKALVALRRRCTTASGYEEGEPLGTYELSHIWPVKSAKFLGLLCVENLVIAPKIFNRQHSQKFPVQANSGKAIPCAELTDQWMVGEGADSLQVLKLARTFIGEEFDKWLTSFLISNSQRDQLIKNLVKAGLPKRRLQELQLRQLKALAEEEEIPYFDISIPPQDVRTLVCDETERLGLCHEFGILLQRLQGEDCPLEPSGVSFAGSREEQEEFEKFVINQVFLSLHGQPHIDSWKGIAFGNYVRKKEAVLMSIERALPRLDDEDYIF
jgi:predicted nucleic acid-binding Zn ribbon protein